MNAFLERLTPRERIFVIGGAAFVAALIAAQLIIGPLLAWRSNAAERRAGAEDLYRLVAEAGALGGGAASASISAKAATPVRNAIADSAAAEKISLTYVNARPDGAVEANATASSEALYRWLGALDRDYGVMVVAADIARESSGAGLRAQLTLSRPRASP
jgi:type II secretory pathway component PulM